MNIEPKYSEPRIYAYSSPGYPGWLKVGYTDRLTPAERIAGQRKTGDPDLRYRIEVDEPAAVADGGGGFRFFRDKEVHAALEARGFERKRFADARGRKSEWVRCTAEDVLSVVRALREARDPTVSEKPKETFGPRPEQAEAVRETAKWFRAHPRRKGGPPPSFLWNAKMRFGKTFATYELAREMGWKRVLVLTFKPSVEDAWQKDLEGHADFAGWQFVSGPEGARAFLAANSRRPVVWFGSFQDFLQLDAKTGAWKPRVAVAFAVDWDCVVVDEYHFGAWREANRAFTGSLAGDETDEALGGEEARRFRAAESPLRAAHYLMLSGTPFRAIKNGEFAEDQVFNWTYSDEQAAKEEWPRLHPDEPNPYASLPRMNLLVYRLPDSIARVAEREEQGFDLNEFFRAERKEDGAAWFAHESEVCKWLDFLRGEFFFGGPTPALPFHDASLKRALRHTVWYLPDVAACEAMENLLKGGYHSRFFRDYEIYPCFGTRSGVGKKALEALEGVRGDPLGTLSVTLTCGKLVTGTTVPAWSAIFMLRNLSSPETYFQAAFRVQSPWTMRNVDGRSPNAVTILKENCYVFDFAPTRALAQIADYSANLSAKNSVPAENVRAFTNFMPVICYDGSKMAEVDPGEILDLAYLGVSGAAMARRWNSSELLNITPEVVDSILADAAAKAAVEKIEGWQNPRGDMKAYVNRTKELGALRKKAAGGDKAAKRQLTEKEKEQREAKRRIERKLRQFATRIPVFMYLSDYREKALVDVIQNLESDLFTQVTGLTLADFDLLLDKGVFNAATMNSCIWQFRSYEEESLDYLHARPAGERPELVGGWDSAVPVARKPPAFDYDDQFPERSAMQPAAEPTRRNRN